ncbi:MoaD/ThiS family protein [Sulfurimonas sp.]|uniref:sulfur carrier protein ThiS n=1 Tax=Sulfurimonas sp. TaxID=2022749 RepID=UPI002B47A712|nr:MoaD/ThiS family protein [Sulfurimonas sp.]
MKLIVNRKEMTFDDNITLQDVINKVNMSDKMMGASVNGTIITICDISRSKLKDGDKVDIIPAMVAG